MRQVDRVGISLILCCCVLFLSGCESNFNERVPVSGTVEVNGEKLERGVVTFISVDNPDIVEGAEVGNGVFECEILTGEKIVRCSGSKVVGTYAPDPLFSDKVKDKLEELPESAFDQEIRINVKHKGDYFVIRYGADSSSENEKPTPNDHFNLSY